MDLLSDILDTIELKGQLYFRTAFSPPWSVAVPSFKRAVRFHLVARGHCWVRPEGGSGVELNAGDAVLITAGAAHTLADAAERPAVALETVLAQSGFSGAGTLVWGNGSKSAASELVCGHFMFADGADHPLLRALPRALIVTSAERAQYPWLDEVLRMIVRQIFSGEPGAHASVRRLSEVLFIEIVRATAGQSQALSGILTALGDPKIARAIAAMHKNPERAWTVETLAAEAAMSRSSFAERFQELMGCGPLGYLADWRMQMARALLARSETSVAEIAARVGYQSAAAFTRAYSHTFGEPPTATRRESE